jgi:hypothetical protein
MMPRLDAEEQLGQVSALAVGTGSAKKSEADKYLRDLRRMAKGEKKPTARTVDELRAMGIPVTFTPKKKKEEDG